LDELEVGISASISGRAPLAHTVTQKANDYEIYPSLRKLTVRHCKTKISFEEIMYIKNKFPNLKELEIISK
jgi:hypothetical protein